MRYNGKYLQLLNRVFVFGSTIGLKIVLLKRMGMILVHLRGSDHKP